MSNRHFAKIGAARQVGPAILALVLVAWATGASGSDGESLGTFDRSGLFVPKVRIVKAGPSIIVTKIDPGVKFDSLRIRFILPAASSADPTKDIFIQWEKQPEQWGKLWRISGHRGLNREQRLFTAPWTTARSFVLLDRSPARQWTTVPWDRTIQIWLDGQRVLKPAGGEGIAGNPARLVHFDDDGNAIKPSARAVEVASALPQPPISPTIDKTVQQALETKYQELTDRLNRIERSIDTTVDKGLEKKYYDVRDRVSRMEQSLSIAQRWSFWGPLLSLGLAIVFSSAAIFWAFVRIGGDSDRVFRRRHMR